MVADLIAAATFALLKGAGSAAGKEAFYALVGDLRRASAELERRLDVAQRSIDRLEEAPLLQAQRYLDFASHSSNEDEARRNLSLARQALLAASSTLSSGDARLPRCEVLLCFLVTLLEGSPYEVRHWVDNATAHALAAGIRASTDATDSSRKLSLRPAGVRRLMPHSVGPLDGILRDAIRHDKGASAALRHLAKTGDLPDRLDLRDDPRLPIVAQWRETLGLANQVLQWTAEITGRTCGLELTSDAAASEYGAPAHLSFSTSIVWRHASVLALKKSMWSAIHQAVDVAQVWIFRDSPWEFGLPHDVKPPGEHALDCREARSTSIDIEPLRSALASFLDVPSDVLIDMRPHRIVSIRYEPCPNVPTAAEIGRMSEWDRAIAAGSIWLAENWFENAIPLGPRHPTTRR